MTGGDGAGVESDRGSKVRDGLVKLPLARQRRAEVVVCIGELGPQPDRLLEVYDRLGKPLAPPQV
jgi:hypothetical protein